MRDQAKMLADSLSERVSQAIGPSIHSSALVK